MKDDQKFQVDYEETIQDDRTLQETDEEKRRRLLNLPQQPSLLHKRKNNRTLAQNDVSHHPNNSNSSQKQNDDNLQRRKDRNKQANKQNNGQKTSNNRNQLKDGDQRTNPNTLKNKIQEKGKEQFKKQAKRRANLAAKQARQKLSQKGIRKAIKAGSKVAVKALKKLLVKGIALATKALVALISTIGLPALLIGAGVVILIFILMSLSSAALGTGNGSDYLGEEAQELRAYIVEVSQSTVDPNRPEQQLYKVPEELLAAIVQLDSWLENPEGEQTSLDKYKELIDEFAEALKPEFTYETFNEWTKTSKRVCAEEETKEVDGKEVTTCVRYEWSEPTQTDNHVEKITKVVAWNGTGTYEYEAQESEWVVNGDTRTKTLRYVIKSQNFEYNFSKLDSVLNAHGYDLEDKKWFEYFYESATETPMHYIEWLENGAVNFGGGAAFFFDGEIIPGAGVPPQFMPYYRAAEEKYGVPWYVLAAIHFHETTFSTNPTMVSSVGAIGHMQFMPLTWIGWNYPGGTSLGYANIPKNILTDPQKIKQYGGYGVDANGDGKADPWDVEDAIHTAAKYLAANGYAQNPRQAIRAYNHSETYVNNILSTAEKFKNAATYKPNGLPAITDGDFMVPMANAVVTSGFGMRWGRKHAGIDFDVVGADTAPVVAAADGIVVRSYYSSSYGNCIIIRHNIRGKQYETLYAHLNNRQVKEGQKVSKGQFIGMMGNTGRSTGPHLHFEIHHPHWAAGQPYAVNPALYLDL
jgi:murein DD-endopeptidase MepM/ murein hydrolase activator NlpD